LALTRPLIIVWLGVGNKSCIVVAIFIAFFPVVVSTAAATSVQETHAQRRMIAGIQFAAWRDDLVSLVSPSKSRTAGIDVKRPRSIKQFTLATARAPAVVSATAAMKTPQRRQIRKSQVRVPKR